LGKGGGITVSALTAGTHTITASVTDAAGKATSTAITVSIDTSPTIAITMPASGSSFEPGAAIPFTATATDAEDGSEGAGITWTSSRDGALGTGSSITVSTLTTGIHTVTASVTDAAGRTASRAITIAVDASPTVTIFSPTSESTFEPRAAITFTGTASDAEEGSLTPAIAWT